MNKNKIIKLKNGIEIVNIYSNSPLVKMRFLFKVGSRNEKANQYGLAHFIEHMVFNGTKNRSRKQIDGVLKNIGRIYNAYTDYEKTLYIVDALKEDMHQAIDLFSDMLCNPKFSNFHIKKEKGVVLEELYETLDDLEEEFHDLKHEMIFKDQELSHSVIGFEDQIKSFSKTDLFDFHKKFYCKQNLRIIFIGDLSIEKAIELTERYFVSLPQGEELKTSQTAFQSGCMFLKDNLNSVNIELCFGNNNHNSEVEQLLLQQILGDRIYLQSTRRSLAYSPICSADDYSDCQIISVIGKCSNNNVKKLLDVFIEEINKIKTSYVADKELSLAKKSIKMALIKSSMNNGYVISKALMEKNVYDIKFNYEIEFDKIDSLSKKDLRDFAIKALSSENLAYIIQGKSMKDFYSFKQLKEMLS